MAILGRAGRGRGRRSYRTGTGGGDHRVIPHRVIPHLPDTGGCVAHSFPRAVRPAGTYGEIITSIVPPSPLAL